MKSAGIVLYHRKKNADPISALSRNENQTILGEFRWQTCVREVALAFGEQIPDKKQLSGHEIYHGKGAVQFLLEVVCGLQSPVKGETEVHGQFREFYKNLNGPILEICKAIDKEANAVRDSYLRGLGSQSYGSYARKKMKGLEHVHVLGSGHLAQEIMPWIAKSCKNITVHYRSEDKAKGIQSQYPNVQIAQIESRVNPFVGGVLVTAPLKSTHIQEWIGGNWDSLSSILDFRSESNFDPLPQHPGLQSLQEIFQQMETTRQLVEDKVKQAKEQIAVVANQFAY